jgi:hypothetical protein
MASMCFSKRSPIFRADPCLVERSRSPIGQGSDNAGSLAILCRFSDEDGVDLLGGASVRVRGVTHGLTVCCVEVARVVRCTEVMSDDMLTLTAASSPGTAGARISVNATGRKRRRNRAVAPLNGCRDLGERRKCLTDRMGRSHRC